MRSALPVLAALMLAMTSATVAQAQQRLPDPQNQSIGASSVESEHANAAVAPATLSKSFDLALDFDPDVNDWLDRSDIGDCTPIDGGAFVCTLEGPWADPDAPLTGTVTDPESGVTGSLRANCSIDGFSFVSFSVSPSPDDSPLPVVDLVDAGGRVRISCAWRMRVNDEQRSLLSGRATADTWMTAADPGAAIVAIKDDIRFQVAAGTGAFAGLSGDGSTTADASFSMLGSSGELPVDFQLVSLGGRSRVSRAAATPPTGDKGSIAFELHGAAPALHLSAPTSVRARSLRRALVGQTVPRAKCRFSAKTGGRRISLGAARADAEGTVRPKASKLAALTAGKKWAISGSCRIAGSTARDTARIKLTR